MPDRIPRGNGLDRVAPRQNRHFRSGMEAALSRGGAHHDSGRHAGHERRSFLVPHLDEPDFVLAGAKGLHDSVDPVSGHAENNVDAPIADGID